MKEKKKMFKNPIHPRCRCTFIHEHEPKEDRLVSVIFNFLKDHDNNFFKMKKYFQENPQDAIDLLTIGK